MTKLEDIFTKKRHRSHRKVLDSIMPGGENWHKSDGDCLKSCPHFKKCNGWGPSSKLCTYEWDQTPVSSLTLMVLKHNFSNFDYYNKGDVKKLKNTDRIISEIMTVLDFPFDNNSLSPSQATAIVKVRLKQAEFKHNLFERWDGCSLKNVDLDDKYLIASHIKPWARATEDEKISAYNGLLLPSNYDYLFDRYLVTFSETGEIILRTDSPSGEYNELIECLGIDKSACLKQVYPKNKKYLRDHIKIFREKARLSKK